MSNIPPLIDSTAFPASPVTPNERVEVLDVLRGFALFGILLVNMTSFSWPIYFSALGHAPGEKPIDIWAIWFMRFFAEGKFYPLFSLLFGAGIALQIVRAESRGVSFLPFHVRRMLMLLFIGIFHAFLVWEGDILILYSVVGLVLLAFRDCRTRTLLMWILGCLLIPLLIYSAVAGIVLALNQIPEIAEEIQTAITDWYDSDLQNGRRDREIFARGTFSEIMLQRAQNVLYLYLHSIPVIPVILMAFLTGLYSVKRGILKQPSMHLPLIRRVFWCGAVIGIPGNILYVFSYQWATQSWWWYFGATVLHLITAPALMLAYVSVIILLFERERWRNILTILAPVGRMALTNYLLQSLICTTLFYSYGFGFYGELGLGMGMLIAILIFLAQIPFSHWWLRRFYFGPVEWFWRSTTYSTLQPMRRSFSQNPPANLAG